MKRQSFFFALLLTISVFSSCKESDPCDPTTSDSSTPINTFEGGKLYFAAGYGCEHLKIAVLEGSWKEMGRQYGYLLGQSMNEFYKISIRNLSMNYSQLKYYSETTYNNSPSNMQEMIIGMSETSGFSLEKQKIMYVIIPLTSFENIGYSLGCSSMAAWGAYTGGQPLVIGRNVDLGDPFTQYLSYIIAIVYKPTGSPNSVVNINFIGSPTAPTFLNSSCIYIDTHSGKLSDPAFNYEQTMSNNFMLFNSMLNYSNILDVDTILFTMGSPGHGMILNLADVNECRVYEIATYDIKRRTGSGLMVSTNHFIDPGWSGLPAIPSGSDSPPRLSNLSALGERYKGSIDAARMMDIFDRTLSEGGPTTCTIFQVVTVPSDKMMWVKARGFTNWEKIDLNLFF